MIELVILSALLTVLSVTSLIINISRIISEYSRNRQRSETTTLNDECNRFLDTVPKHNRHLFIK